MQLTETAENTPARWEGILADLAAKQQAARDHTERLRSQKQELALEAAMGGTDAKKRLSQINAELAKHEMESTDWDAAIRQAEGAKVKTEHAEAEAAESDRHVQIGAALKQYLAEVCEIDAGLAMLVAHFAAAKQSLDMAEGLMTGTEGQPLQQLRSKWGATLAAAFAGLGSYIELGPASMHTQHRLHSLIVDEVSLVDAPSNASTDPRTGRKTAHARVAFYKRDTGDPRTSNQKEQYMFERILKSDDVTRDQIVTAVQKRASEIAQEHDCSVEIAEKIIWEENPELVAKYETTPKPTNPRRPAPPLVQVTKAEVELDKRARVVMKTDGLSYPQACSKALEADPSLYTQYCNEMAAHQTVTAPDPSKLDLPLDYIIKRGEQAQEDGVCARCDESVDDGDSYCAACGNDLSAQQATAKGKSKRVKTK